MTQKQKIPDEVKQVISSILKNYNLEFEDLVKDQNSSREEEVERHFFSVNDAIRFSGLSRSSLSRLWNAHKFEILKMTPGSRSGKILIDRSSFIKYLESLKIK